MRLPDFFIVGAPKCGTTALSNWLAEHPNVYFSPIKEPHHFNTDARNRKIRSWRGYEALFSGATDSHGAVGEGSVWYLYSDVAVPGILSRLPQARFVVLLRDPLSMFRSLYVQQIWAANENAKTIEAAWDLQDARRNGKHVPRLCANPDQLQYGAVCSLGWQVARLLSRVDRRAVHFVFLEDLLTSPVSTLSGLCSFLGVADHSTVPLRKINEAGVPRSMLVRMFTKACNQGFRTLGIPVLGSRLVEPLNDWNKMPSPQIKYDPQFRNRLLDYFCPDIEILEKVTGRDLAHWKE